MKKKILLLLLLISFTGIAQNKKDILLKDLVSVKGNKYIIHDYTLLSGQDKSIQVAAFAEAPTSGLISRDYFVLIFSQITGQYINNIVEKNDLETKNLSELIGNADMVIKIFIAKNGIQIEVNMLGEIERNTMSWDEFLE